MYYRWIKAGAIFGIMICVVFTVACGGGGGGGDDNDTVIPDYTTLVLDGLPDTMILDVPTRKTVAEYCYLESFSMQVAFIDNTIPVEEVFAFAGLGAPLFYSSFNKAFEPNESYVTYNHLDALLNYGLNYVLGSSSSAGYSQLYDNAYGKISYATEAGALNYLQAAICSDRPVQVHIDLGYLPSLSKYAPIDPGQGSHFILVTGYDPDGIYLNETWLDEADQNQYKNFEVPLDEFLQAWQKGGEIAAGEVTQTGPYWMCFLDETPGSALPEKKTLEQILTAQKALAANVSTTINNNLDSDYSGSHWTKIADVKALFGDYLTNNGYAGSGAAYTELEGFYDACVGMTTTQIRTQLETVIEPKEAEAQAGY